LALPAARIFPDRGAAPELFAGALARLAGIPVPARDAPALSGAFQAGSDYAAANFPDFERHAAGGEAELAVLSGADAAALGAAAAGCRFFVSTGRNTRLRLAFDKLYRRAGARLVLSDAGDALEAATMALGAGHAGVRAVAEISCGGMRLASEAARWGSGTEVPMVLVTADPDAERLFPGPLFIAASIEGACRRAFEALDLADRYQCPAALLLRGGLSGRIETIAPFDLPRPERGLWRVPEKAAVFDRYAAAADGVSPRAVPGHVGLCFRAEPADRARSGGREIRIKKLREKAAAIRREVHG